MSQGSYPITPIEVDALIERAVTRIIKGQNKGEGECSAEPQVLAAFCRYPGKASIIVNSYLPWLLLDIGTTWRSNPEIGVFRWEAKRIAGTTTEYEPNPEKSHCIQSWGMRSRGGRNMVNMFQRGFVMMVREHDTYKRRAIQELHVEERNTAIQNKYKAERRRLAKRLTEQGLAAAWRGPDSETMDFEVPFAQDKRVVISLDLHISTKSDQDPLSVDISKCTASFSVAKCRMVGDNHHSYSSSFSAEWGDMCQFIERFVSALQSPSSQA